MIPLRDSIPSSRPPALGYAIIILNVLVFFGQLSLGPRLEEFIRFFGFVPRNFFLNLGHGNVAAAILPIFTSMFLHGGWLHLLANMWTLYIFGDNVEDTLGRAKFLILYLGSGVAGCLAQLLSGPSSPIPMVGASGAIAGVMGAYFSLFPAARVLTLVPVLFFVIIEVPAYVFLGLWFILQFVSGAFSFLGSKAHVGVAFWAHVGRFAAGFLLLRLLAPGRARNPFAVRP
ncbi:MAG: rhomboid family intramembrane serine protease [Desulfobaccales bacterium]